MKNLLTLLFLVLFSQSGAAHLGGGEDRVIGDYLVEFSYSPGAPVQDEETFIALSLANNTTIQPIDVEKVLVRISDPYKVIFSGSLLPENRNAAFTYVFPRAGSYDIEAVFYKNGIIFTSAKFSLAVQEKTSPFTPFAAAMILILLYIVSKSGFPYKVWGKLRKSL
ncbi:MAG: hypothetical protein HYT71_04180 [Candidatus Aenigmarchaeota archaeon]|nr:hypothetical protein [Candidatus Aenigmarchaeota archaeon]